MTFFFQTTIKYIKKQKFRALDIQSRNKDIWPVSYVTFVDIIAQFSLTRLSIFLFFDVPTLKLRIIILFYHPEIILLTTRATKIKLPSSK